MGIKIVCHVLIGDFALRVVGVADVECVAELIFNTIIGDRGMLNTMFG